jgi:hypothetical protein
VGRERGLRRPNLPFQEMPGEQKAGALLTCGSKVDRAVGGGARIVLPGETEAGTAGTQAC